MTTGPTFEQLKLEEVDFNRLDAFEDRLFSQRKCWIDFLAAFVPGEPVIAALMDRSECLGYFTGYMMRRGGLKILASPFRGWTTPYMGFNLRPDVDRGMALGRLEDFAFRQLACHHLEVCDRFLVPAQGTDRRFACRIINGYLSDLTQTEQEIFDGMSSSCRRAIRKARKSGVVVEVSGPDGFAAEFYQHLCHVFAKQGLKPSYGEDRVAKLIDNVYPTGNLLLLRALSPDNECIATGIYPRFAKLSFFWGNGSRPDFLHLRPNEALHHRALSEAKAFGAESHDWGGGGAYKTKYGGQSFVVPAFWKSRHRAIQLARDTAERLYYFPRVLKRRIYDRQIDKQRHLSKS